MRIHLQNPDNDPLFDFSRAMWEAAAARAPDIGAEHTISIGVTPADFVAAMRDAEALVTDARVIRALFPCPAPRLKLIFLTNAGLDRLAPFDWLPQGVALPALPGIIDVKQDGRLAIATANAFAPDLANAYESTGARVQCIETMTLEEIFVANV